MSKKRKVLLGINLVTVAAALAVLTYLWVDDIILQEDGRRIVEQCTTEVKMGCPLLYRYTSELERQNALLNARVKECDVLIPDAGTPATDTGR